MNTGPPLADLGAGPPASVDANLNLKQVARRLGLHYMTVYRYVRQGRLTAIKEGAAWWVSQESVDQLAAERLVEPVPTEAGTGPARRSAAPWDQRFARCLLSGDETAAWRVIQAALASGRTPAFCYVDMLSAALTSIGASGEAGEISVADQHIATAVAARVASRLGALSHRPGRSRGSVVFGAPLGELHSLPIAIAADLVRLAGFNVLELGANVPPEAFALAAERAPRLVAVGVGITRAEQLGAAQEAVNAVRAVDAEVPVLVGGQAAISAEGAALVGVTAWASDGPEAVTLVEVFARRR